jgi:DNA-binding LacI/PurR family transcriptional regulator
MRDVAERAGVSRSLVSTVFRGVPGASPATRERVLAAAAELGYRPDDRARKLRSRDSRLIGVTLTAAHPFHVAVTDALHEEELLGGYELSISWTTRSRTLAKSIDALLAQRCAALVLIGPTVSDDDLESMTFLARELPVVVVDRYLELPTVDTLRVDDAQGVRLAVEHLKSLGHRDISYLDGGEFVSAQPRRAAYLKAMKDAGLENSIDIVPAGGTRVDGALAASRMLGLGNVPRAIVAYNDQCALGVLDVFARKGVRVPEDVSIVGFDNVPEAALEHLSLTTVEQRADLLAIAVSKVVLSRIAGRQAGGLRLMPPGPLVIRSSTGPPSAGS